MLRTFWREVEHGDGCERLWQHCNSLAVLGTVALKDGKYIWTARVDSACELEGKTPRGKVLTLAAAKHVVEVLLDVTGTYW